MEKEKFAEQEVGFAHELLKLIEKYDCDLSIEDNRLSFCIGDTKRTLPYNLKIDYLGDYLLINSTAIGKKYRKELERLDEINFQIANIFKRNNEESISKLPIEDQESMNQLFDECEEIRSRLPEELSRVDYLSEYPVLSSMLDKRSQFEEYIASHYSYTEIDRSQIETLRPIKSIEKRRN